MKATGSRRVYFAAAMAAFALTVFSGCSSGSGGPGFKVTLLSSAGIGGLTVKVDGPQFPVKSYAMPTGVGATKRAELPGDAGDVIEFTALYSTLQATTTCTVTDAIVDTSTYGQVNIDYDPGQPALSIRCSSGWLETPGM